MPYNNKIQKIRMLRRCADLKEGGIIFGCPVRNPERYGVASSFVQAIQERQRLEIVFIEEIAFRKGYIDRKKLQRLSQEMAKNEYGQYLMGIVSEGEGENHDAQSGLDRFNPAFQLPLP
jgi:dTDP-glucose pyrophosphorylase